MEIEKRPVGRPRLPDNVKRGPSLTIYFKDDDQRERFKSKAKKHKMPVRKYAESIIKEKADK